MKIKLHELDKHRNETTFRPYLLAQEIFKNFGITFTEGEDQDLTLVAQASILDKKKNLDDSVNTGLDNLSKIGGEYIIIDGQDSTSLLGSFEVFKNSSALFLLKNSLLNKFDYYKKGLKLGRYYWGDGEYSIPEIDEYKDKIFLSGSNWLSVLNPQWQNFIQKEYDVCALFQYPQEKESKEHGVSQSVYYNSHRKLCVSELSKSTRNIVKLEDGKKIPQDEYYQKMFTSKIIVAPFGYGEMAPRDIESAVYGSILIKPCMSHIDSEPFVYQDNKTYIACKHDYSDLNEKIDYALSNYEELQNYLVNNLRKSFSLNYHPLNLVKYIYNLFLKQNIL